MVSEAKQPAKKVAIKKIGTPPKPVEKPKPKNPETAQIKKEVEDSNIT